MSELPSSWVQASLAEFGGLIGGKTPSKSVSAYWTNGTIPWTSPKDMKAFLIKSTEDLIATKAVHEAGMQVLPVDSILMVTRSGILAHTFPVAITAVPTAINQDIKALRPSPAFIPRYIAYALRNTGEQILFSCSKAGTTVASVETDLLERFPLPIAPLPEQKRIADKLDAVLVRVDACRERLDRIPAILKRFRQSILAAATSGKLTEEWREERGVSWSDALFEDLLAKEVGAIRRGPFGSAIKKSFFVLDGYKVYEQKNAIQDDADLGTYFIDEVKFKELEGFSVRGGDFIVSCAGTIGRISQLPLRARPGVINQALMRVRLDGTIAEASYFLMLFRAPEFQAQILEQTQGSAMQNMAAIKVIRRIPIRLPSLEEQHEIVRRVESLFAYADRLEACYNAARAQVERLTPALLAKAFRGELVPQDPNDEPASVLLERIRALGVGQNKRSVSGNGAVPKI